MRDITISEECFPNLDDFPADDPTVKYAEALIALDRPLLNHQRVATAHWLLMMISTLRLHAGHIDEQEYERIKERSCQQLTQADEECKAQGMIGP